jgi:hypothetical protein
MYRLTLDHANAAATTTVSEHCDAADAKRALAQYVDNANCQTRGIQLHADHNSWDPLSLDYNRVHATATIENDRTAVAPVTDFSALPTTVDPALHHVQRAS